MPRVNRRKTTWWLTTVGTALCLNACAVIEQAATQAPDLNIEAAHPGASTRVEFDHDGSRIVTGGYQGEIHVWTVPDGRRLHTLRGHRDTVQGLAWLDEQTLVSGADDGRIIVWDLDTEQPGRTVRTADVTALIDIPRRRELVSGHSDGQVRRWSYPNLSLLGSYRMGGRVLSVAARSDGEQLAVSNNREEVVLLTPSLTLIRRLPTAGKDALELRYSPDGRQLAAGTWFDLHFWDLATGALTVKETEHIGALISVDYTPDGTQLVSLGRHTDSKIRLLDLQSGQLTRRLASHDYCGYSVRVGPHGRFVASVSDDESVRLYDIQSPYRPTLKYPPIDLP